MEEEAEKINVIMVIKINKNYNSYKVYIMNNNDNTKEGGYKSLAFFKQSEIIYDFTVEFCQKYIEGDNRYKSYKYYSRQSDQLIQAARSGKQNIAEGYLQKSLESRLKLLNVARGSLEELLNDYLDFLRQKGLPLWEKGSSEAQVVRNLVYNKYNSYKDYKGYIGDPEKAANAMICLINQTNQLLDQKLRWTEEQFVKEGGFRENLLKKRLAYRQQQSS